MGPPSARPPRPRNPPPRPPTPPRPPPPPRRRIFFRHAQPPRRQSRIQQAVQRPLAQRHSSRGLRQHRPQVIPRNRLPIQQRRRPRLFGRSSGGGLRRLL